MSIKIEKFTEEVEDNLDAIYSKDSERYYSNYFSYDNYVDLSYQIIYEGKVACVFRGGVRNNKLSYYDMSSVSYVAKEFINTEVEKHFFSHFKKMIKKEEITEVLLKETNSGLVTRYLCDKVSSITNFESIIDLTKTEEQIFFALDKSCKHPINWGKKNLELKIYDHTNVTEELIEEFRLYHINIAGKETRSKQTWVDQYNSVKLQKGFVITASINNEVIHYSFYLHNKKHCYYGVSASDRDLFDKPISHYPLYAAIIKAKQEGCNVFLVGQIYGPNNNVTPKEKNIGKYKKIFANNVHPQLYFIGKL